MSRVFVYELPRNVSLEPTKPFGEAVSLIQPDVRRPGVFHPTEMVEFLCTELQRCGFDPTKDYVCLVGGLIGNALLVSAVTSQYPAVNLLLWDASAERYESRTLARPCL